MNSTLIDILVLGLLLLVFGSIYRTRKTLRLRYWIAGWLLVLLHFSLNFANPVSTLWNSILGGAYIAALLAGGLCFLVAGSWLCTEKFPGWRVQTLLFAPFLAYIFLTTFSVSGRLALGLVFLLTQISLFWYVYGRWGRRPRLISATELCALATILWAAHDIYFRRAIPGVNALLMEVFFINALVYWSGFRRRATGVYTATVGLIAWGAVFPVATALQALLPHLHVPGEVWNLPKYVVEFGMILTLLQDEVFQQMSQKEEYRMLFDGNPHPMWIFDSETLRFLKVNTAAVAHYGYSEKEFLSMTLRDIRPPEDVPRLEHRILDAGESTMYSGPWTHIRQDGSRIQVEIASHGITFEGHRARFSLVQDVTERQQLYERLVHQAHHDMLTGLPNRLLLKDRMEQMLAAAERLSQPTAMLCMDLDRFKHINDTYGHHVGDVCLQRVATTLRERLRMTDTMARSGGEEFIVLLGQLKTPEDAGHVAQVLLDGLRQAIMVDGNLISITASIGIAIYPIDGTAIPDLWRLADSAMYRAKRAGGNQFLFAADNRPTQAAEALALGLDRTVPAD